MNLTSGNPALQCLSYSAVAITVLASALLAAQYSQLPEQPLKAAAAGNHLPAWPTLDFQALSFEGLTFIKQAAEPGTAQLGPLAKRFRLAGTFFAASSYQQSRKAILDDIPKKDQRLVAEGDLLDQSILVVSIARDRIVLRDGSNEEQLWLSFSEGEKKATFIARADAAVSDGQAEAALLRFGNRTGERRWLLRRDAVLRYYQELLNNPDRLATVFESLKPVYQGNKIAGYTLDVEGEGDVFGAFGLKQGDIIRKVNSMPMISQGRAEFFINEFVKDRANAFVLDIERNGQPEKLIYLLR